MLDLQGIKNAFPKLENIAVFSTTSGQKLVFTATHSGQPVALKLIKKTGSEESRTLREINAVGKLNSTYVPKVYDFGKKKLDGADTFYIVEQFIPGQTYRQHLRKSPRQSLDNTLALGHALFSACVDFENARFVHRDIKPENLILDTKGKIWVIDFGLARPLDTTSITPSGLYRGVGTIGYAAPEQFRNDKSELDIRADIYSTGIVLYESLFGSNPYLTGAQDQLVVIRRMESKDLPRLTIPGDTTGSFSQLLQSVTSRFPSRRPQSATEALTWFKDVSGKCTKSD